MIRNPKYISANVKKLKDIDIKSVLKEVNKKNKEIRDSFKNPDMSFKCY